MCAEYELGAYALYLTTNELSCPSKLMQQDFTSLPCNQVRGWRNMKGTAPGFPSGGCIQDYRHYGILYRTFSGWLRPRHFRWFGCRWPTLTCTTLRWLRLADLLDPETGPQWPRTLLLFLFLGLLLSYFQSAKAFSFHNWSSLNFAHRLKTLFSTIAPCRIFQLSPK